MDKFRPGQLVRHKGHYAHLPKDIYRVYKVSNDGRMHVSITDLTGNPVRGNASKEAHEKGRAWSQHHFEPLSSGTEESHSH